MRLVLLTRLIERGLSAVETLFAGLIAGAIGVAYIVYGRRQTKFAPVIAGVLLCACPYVIDSVLWLCVAGALLMAAPWVLDF